MIKSIRLSNFYSFASETEVDFTLGKKPTPSGFDIDLADGSRLNKIIAVVGANGSGKTQLIKPLAFLSWFVCDSFLENAPDNAIFTSLIACTHLKRHSLKSTSCWTTSNIATSSPFSQGW